MANFGTNRPDGPSDSFGTTLAWQLWALWAILGQLCYFGYFWALWVILGHPGTSGSF